MTAPTVSPDPLPPALRWTWRAQLADVDAAADPLPDGVVGRVEGIALVYDVIDSYGTMFARGALGDAPARAGRGEIKLYWDHGNALSGSYSTDDHIGVVRTLEDVDLPSGQTGVRMAADLFDTLSGRKAHEYLRAVAATGSETGLSIGGRFDGDDMDIEEHDGETVLVFRRVELREVSVTAMPAVPGAVVTFVRQRARQDAAAPAPVPDSPARTADSAAPPASTPQGRRDAGADMSTTTEKPDAGASAAAPALSVGEDRGKAAEQIARLAQIAGMPAMAADLIARGATVSQAQDELLKAREAEATRAAAASPDMGGGEEREYSVFRAIQAQATGDWSRAGLEREVHERITRRLNREPSRGQFYMPTRGLGGSVQRSTLSAGTANKGGNVVEDEMRSGDFIELLRQRTLVIGTLGARLLTGLQGDIIIPRQSAAMTAGWESEAPGADITPTSLTLAQVTMSPKTLAGMTYVSKQLLTQSSVDIEQLVRDDLVALHQRAIDSAALAGTGTAVPGGVIYNTDTNLVTFGTNGGTFTLAKAIEFQRALETSNYWNAENAAWVTTPGVKADLRARVRIASSDSRTIWDSTANTIEGVRAFSTNHMPSNLTKGTSTTVAHAAIYGDFSQMFIGEWGAAEIQVDPYTLAGRNLTRVISFQLVDIKFRHPTAFVRAVDVLV